MRFVTSVDGVIQGQKELIHFNARMMVKDNGLAELSADLSAELELSEELFICFLLVFIVVLLRHGA